MAPHCERTLCSTVELYNLILLQDIVNKLCTQATHYNVITYFFFFYKNLNLCAAFRSGLGNKQRLENYPRGVLVNEKKYIYTDICVCVCNLLSTIKIRPAEIYLSNTSLVAGFIFVVRKTSGVKVSRNHDESRDMRWKYFKLFLFFFYGTHFTIGIFT